MKLEEADLDQSFFQPIGKAVDTTVGHVLVGIFLLLIFTLLLFGIQRVQNVSLQTVVDPPQPVTEVVTEIGESTSQD